MRVKLLLISIGIIAVILIANPFLLIDSNTDDFLNGSIEQSLTSDNLTIVSCPTGYSQSHLDVWTENTFDAIPMCASNSGFDFITCNEEIVNSEGMIEKVECE